VLEARHVDRLVQRFALEPGAALSGPVARGEQGQVWRLSTPTRSWAVKELFEPLHEDEVREDARFQDAVHAAHVPLPAVIRTVDGDVLADVDGSRVRVYEWVDLRERDAMLNPADVGGLVASIHRVHDVGSEPVDPWYVDPVGAARWDELVSALAAGRAPFAEDLAALRDELVALETLLEPPSSLQTCHRDLWADNVRMAGDGTLCVIDWENAGLADPSQELGLVLFEFGCGDPRRVRALDRAYRDGGGPGRVDRPTDFSMVIAQLGHIGERWCSIWLDPASSELERGRAVTGIGEFTESPLTRSAIDEMLDAVAAGGR
jgi:thiamine kinase-like enzyme